MTTAYDIIIIGAGPAGLTAALAAVRADFTVALIDTADIHAPRHDSRASTLAASSLKMLGKLGVTERLNGALQPVSDMMIGEGCVGDISPLSLHFDGDQRDTPMAHMVENEHLRRACVAQVTATAGITLFAPAVISDMDTQAAKASVTLESGDVLYASLLIAADGRNSQTRKAADISVSHHDYDQKALVVTLSHSRPHQGVAHQLFLTGGPFAILPMTDNRACIVWSDKTKAINAALSLGAAAFKSELSRRIGDVLGEITVISEPSAYPLRLQIAEHYTQGRTALVGDAAHVILPLAGQGLNMGLRDVAALMDCVKEARAQGLDIGGASLVKYGQWRRFDNASLASVTDGLNTLFSNRIAPLRHLRRLGLLAVDKTPALSQFLMAEAAGEMGDLPSLLR